MIIRTLSLLVAGLLLATSAHASEAEHVRASHAWIRILPGDLPAGAYVVLENAGDQPVTLRSASSSRYGSVMLHKSSSDGGMSRMAMVDSLVIPARGKAELSPGGYHLMMSKANPPVKVGDDVKLTLRFDDGSALETDFVTRPSNATDAGEPHQH